MRRNQIFKGAHRKQQIMFIEKYERKLKGNSIILTECTNIDEKNTFEERMICENRIKGFLPCFIRLEDEKSSFVYDITSKQNLTQMFEERELKEKDLIKIISGIIDVRERLQEYLLSDDNLILNPQFLYMDPETRIPSFIFYPYYHMNIHESLVQLGTFLLEKTDHSDDRAVTLVYGFYKSIIKEDYSFENLIQKESIEKDAIREEPIIDNKEEESYFENEIIDNYDYGDSKDSSKVEKVAFGISISMLIMFIIILIGIVVFDLDEKIAINNSSIIGLSAFAGAISISIPMIITISNIRKRLKKEKYEKIEEEVLLSEAKSNKEIHQNSSFGKTEDFKERTGGCKRLVSFEEDRITEFRINKETYLIGKSHEECDGYLDFPEGSRIHAKISMHNGDYYITDMNSTNGTGVNGRMIEPNESVKLQANDEVSFAGKVFYFR